MDITALDNVWIQIACDDSIARELSDYFSFEVPGAQFMKRRAAYKHWDSRIRLFKLRTRTIYRGLLPRVLEFAHARNYSITNRVPAAKPLYTDLDDAVSNLNLPVDLRDYQQTSLRILLDNHRRIILSPTGSGKSLVIYLISQLLRDTKVLIVVPTIGLVAQMVKDFVSYGLEERIHTIHAGCEKQDTARLFVSTWQSIYKMPPDYFNQFETVICDEVHLAKAKSLTSLLEKCNAPYRFGFTGTLDELQCHRLMLEGLFGSVTQVTTTAKLVEKQQLSPLHVKMLVLEYPDGERKIHRHDQYQDEVDFIVQHAARLEFVAQLAKHLKGNTLVLFNYVEKHGIPLHERIQRVCKGKDVHYIAGSIDGDERETIRQWVTGENDNQVIVASFGTFSTGINIPNIRHLVFASPSKSKIRVLQSIGRAARLHELKDHATIWDIVDDLRIGKHVNHTFKHAQLRAQYYSTEKFPTQLQQIPLTKFVQARPVDAGATNES